MQNKKISKRLLDELDLRIAAELEGNARQTTRELARKLGVSATTISNRIQRMVDEEAIAFCTVTDALSVGFRVRKFFGINVTPGKAMEAVKALDSCNNVQRVTLTMGRYDIVITAVFPRNQDLLDWIANEVSRYPGVQEIQDMTVLKVVKRSHTFLHDRVDPYDNSNARELDDSELKLVEALELNPRESIASLGKRIGTNRWAAARKLQRLLDEQVIWPMITIDPHVLGLAVRAYIFLRVRPDRIIQVADTLAANQNVPSVVIVTGQFAIMIVVAFPDIEELASFIINDIGKVPGVIGHETMIHVGQPHPSFRLIWR